MVLWVDNLLMLNIIHWSFIKCLFPEFHRSSKILVHFIVPMNYQIIKNHILKHPFLWEKSLSIGELSSSQEWKQIFQNSNLCLIASVFSKAIYTVRCFPWSGRLTWFFLSDCLLATQLRVTHSWPAILSRKNCVEKGN